MTNHRRPSQPVLTSGVTNTHIYIYIYVDVNIHKRTYNNTEAPNNWTFPKHIVR